MTHKEKISYLIKYLVDEDPGRGNINIPSDEEGKKKLLRSLVNIRPPKPVSEEFLNVEDEYLREEAGWKNITSARDLPAFPGGLCLWKGDITALKADAIVNAANSSLLGCFIPCHGCVDNAIHSAAGIRLRLTCHEIMEKRGGKEETGKAIVTPAFNLPSKYVIHTVGPVVYGNLTEKECGLLQSSYVSCLEAAASYNLESIAFCCISTGEFRFPNEKAAEIAVTTVRDYLKKSLFSMKIIFNVFKEKDYEIYKKLLGGD